MLALLTQSVLDVGFGILWWTAKKTGSALSYGVGYIWSNEEEEEEEEDNQVINMSDFREILEANNKKIEELSNKIDELTLTKNK